MNKKNNFLLILYIVFLISFISCSREKKNIIGVRGTLNTGSISVRVIDTNSQPVQDATIWTEPTTYSVSSSNNGDFTISFVPAGTYTVKASKTGYNTKSETVIVTAGEKTNINIVLSQSTGGDGGGGGGGGTQGPKMTISYTRNSNNPSGTGASRTAVWIENSSGVLIRTLYRSVGLTYSGTTPLSNWETKSGKQSNNTTDTYTSATVNGGTSGSSYQWTWNLKDSSGNIVPDGDYKITIEISRYTNTNTAYYQFVLTKGQVSANTSVSVTQTAPNDMLQSLSGSYTSQ